MHHLNPTEYYTAVENRNMKVML